MKVFISSDHAGFELKNVLYEYLFHKKFDIEDIGPSKLDPKDDYPQFAFKLTAKLLGEDDNARGILVCGTGQGMAIAANRVAGIRAALAWNEEVAKDSRRDEDTNVLALPAWQIKAEDAKEIVDAWLKEKFSGAARHKRRIREIEDLYG